MELSHGTGLFGKGFLRLSLVTCPAALYPAASESEKISFNQLNRRTGHRIKYVKVDSGTGKEVATEDIELESTRTIDIQQFVPREEIDPRYIIPPYYIAPNSKLPTMRSQVIRETIREMNVVAIGTVVLTSREHNICLETLDKGLVGTLLRYPYEVRAADEYFDEIEDVKVTKDMLDLARHIVNQKSADFDPEKYEDHYKKALVDLINSKRAGKPIGAKARACSENVVDLMQALRLSVSTDEPAKGRKASAGQKEMLMPIEGKEPIAQKSVKPQRKSA